MVEEENSQATSETLDSDNESEKSNDNCQYNNATTSPSNLNNLMDSILRWMTIKQNHNVSLYTKCFRILTLPKNELSSQKTHSMQ